MEQLGALFFELPSDERMTILGNLSREALKLSHLAQRQDMTVTETSRHLQRLSDAELILKDSEGLYKVTPYGRLILSLLPSLSFVSGNRAYFQEHDTSDLPGRESQRRERAPLARAPNHGEGLEEGGEEHGRADQEEAQAQE